jgi:hypothetical protein
MAEFYGSEPVPGTAGIRMLSSLATLGKKVKEGVTNRLYQNIYPYGYDAQIPGQDKKVGPMQRVFSAVVKGEQEPERKMMEMSPSGFEKEKLDLWGMYLGKGQKFGTIKESPFKPSQSKDPNAKYYTVPKIEEDFPVGEIKAKDINEFREKFATLAETSQLGGAPTGVNRKKGSAIMSQQPLGDAKFSAGEDEKGFYVSYYDKWDINPFAGGSAVESSLAKFFGMDKAEDITGTKGPEIYGRIYFDKKTGKRIK